MRGTTYLNFASVHGRMEEGHADVPLLHDRRGVFAAFGI